MSISYMEGRRCNICGSLITDDNPDGIGFGCRENVYLPAKREMFKLVMWLEVWKAKVEKVRSIFIETYENRKFRKPFKAEFYQSMCTAERISKKQLEIMNSWLFNDHVFVDTEKIYQSLYDKFNPYGTISEDGRPFEMILGSYSKKYLKGRKVSKDV